MLRLWSFLFRRPRSPKARSGPISRPSRPSRVHLAVEPLEDRAVPTAVVGTGTGLLAQYYGNDALTGTAALTRIDPNINFNWGSEKAPAPGLPSTDWSARWTGLVQAQYSQTYTFITVSGDGVRLFVNGKELINDWTDHTAKTDSATISLQAGQLYSIEVDYYYQDTGSAEVQLSWSSPSTPNEVIPASQLYPVAPAGTGQGLTAQYYASTNLTDLVLTRTDPTVDFYGTTGHTSPGLGVPQTNWSACWTGFVQPQYSQTYTFSTFSDGGVRLFVNGQELINSWAADGLVLKQGSITLLAGQKYSIELETFQTTGTAAIELFWTSPSTPQQIIPSSQLYTAPPSAGAVPPSARLSASTVTTIGGATATFTVTYSSSIGINTNSFGSENVLVTGSDGFSQLATLVGTNAATGTATYQITAPAGGWLPAENGTYTVSLRADQVRDLDGNYVPANTLGTFAVSVTADWFSENLKDVVLAQMARTDDADKQLSRNDMLQLLAYVDGNSTVSAADLADLRTLVANGSTLGMPGYVQQLASDVVNGNPADGEYQGKPLPTLATGSPGSVLKDLVNKWFLGLDLPAVGAGVQYAVASGSLFGSSGPHYTDVVQGSLSDCYFLAGLAEVAYRSPSTIESMFINNGDGTYTVRFFNGTQAEYVTVNLDLPESGGTFVYANFEESITNPSNVLWVALAEKAYAQLAASGWSRGAGAANAFSSIALGWEGTAVEQITGQTASLQMMSASATTESALINGAAAGQMIGLDSNDSTAAGIVADHVYVLIGYDAATKLFTCYNPWGYSQQFTWAQIAANFDYWSEG